MLIDLSLEDLNLLRIIGPAVGSHGSGRKGLRDLRIIVEGLRVESNRVG